jgi:hypothetical protein
MILTTHALTGAVIGKNIESPWLVIALSIVVHFTMDHFRHGEYVEVFSKNTSIKNSGWKVLLDIGVGFFVILFFIFFKNYHSTQTVNIIIGALAATFPDFITFLYWKFRWKFLEKYRDFHSWIHKHPRHAPERQWTLRNARNDILISALAIAILFFL